MIDVTDQDFNEKVVEASHQVPVIVDLWAPWCGPCKTLGPILDKVIDEQAGKVAGVKINVDENPAISQAFGVQSIPMVVAFKDGQAVDGFMGAQGEPMVRDFVERLLPTEEENEVEALIAAGDEASLRAALELDNDNEAAITTLAELLVGDGRAEEGLALLDRIPETPTTRHIAALARAADVAEASSDDMDTELEDLLGRVKGDDEARQRFIDLLELMGPDDPRTAQWRRRLSTALF